MKQHLLPLIHNRANRLYEDIKSRDLDPTIINAVKGIADDLELIICKN